MTRGAPGEVEGTVGVDFAQIAVAHAGQGIRLHIWDTAGQESYRMIVRAYFRAAQGVLLFFDITHRASFEDLELWLKELDQGRGGASERPPVIIVGNKMDAGNERAVGRSEATAFAMRHGCMYEEVSAATGENSGGPVVRLTKAIYDVVAHASAYAPRLDEGPGVALLPRAQAHLRNFHSTATKCCRIS
tara:strand:- start:4498 stop:5064 length:567 start_codon:yes stop_codon:yes gene_type:complete